VISHRDVDAKKTALGKSTEPAEKRIQTLGTTLRGGSLTLTGPAEKKAVWKRQDVQFAGGRGNGGHHPGGDVWHACRGKAGHEGADPRVPWVQKGGRRSW